MLPNFLKPYQTNFSNLIRLGRKSDGGYVTKFGGGKSSCSASTAPGLVAPVALPKGHSSSDNANHKF